MMSNNFFFLAFALSNLYLRSQAHPTSTSSEHIATYHSGYLPNEEVPPLQDMHIAGRTRNNRYGAEASSNFYAPTLSNPWPQLDIQISEGPSLATRMRLEEEEDTANSMSHASQQEEIRELSSPSGQKRPLKLKVKLKQRPTQLEVVEDADLAKEDPVTTALREAAKAKWNTKQHAWHTGLSWQHRNMMKVVVDAIMARKKAKSSKCFHETYQTFSPSMIEKIKHVYDTKEDWIRYAAVNDIIDQYFGMLEFEKASRGCKGTWTEGLYPDEIAELRQLLKESKRMRGTKFLKDLDVEGRRKVLQPGTLENIRFMHPKRHSKRPEIDAYDHDAEEEE